MRIYSTENSEEPVSPFLDLSINLAFLAFLGVKSGLDGCERLKSNQRTITGKMGSIAIAKVSKTDLSQKLMCGIWKNF